MVNRIIPPSLFALMHLDMLCLPIGLSGCRRIMAMDIENTRPNDYSIGAISNE